MKIKKEFHNQGALLKEYRLKRGMSQDEFSSKANRNKQLVSNTERGIAGMSRHMMLQAIEHLKIPKTAIKNAYIEDEKMYINNILKGKCDQKR